MTGKDWFGLIVRVVGFGIFLFGIYYVVATVYAILYPTARHRYSANAYLVYYGLISAAGLALMRWAAAVVRFSYPYDRIEAGSPAGE